MERRSGQWRYSPRPREPGHAVALLDDWTATKRFLNVVVNAEGDLWRFSDATTIVGMTQAQFADLLEWSSKMGRVFAECLEEMRHTTG